MKIVMKATLKAMFSGAVMGMIPVVQVTHAQQVVDPAASSSKQSSITQSLNGTAVQNIAAPNARGLSHNQFSVFNVDTKGLVINNSSINAVSQIGGAVVANPNLAGGEARLILNEVTSGIRSMLQGSQELLGGRAGYILANPNGITCDGCGFINFPRATLTTGAPIIDASGQLMGFNVGGGDLAVGPGGLNATGVDYFDIIARTAALNGQVNANDLSLRLGSNLVDYGTLAATSRAAGNVPMFALDSSALGGMYAGRISLIGTEAGVGVRMLGNVAASVSDIDLSVNGQLTLKDNLVGARGSVTLQSTQVATTAGNEIELLNAQVSAGSSLSLAGGDIRLDSGKTVAASDLVINAASLNTTGGQREAGRDLSISATGAVNVAGGTVQADRGLAVSAASLSLSNGAKLMGEADGVDSANGGSSINLTGQLALNGASLFSGNTVDVTAGFVTLDAASNANGTQGLRGKGNVEITAALLNNAGLVASDATLSINGVDAAVTNSGKLYGAGGLEVTAATLDNSSYVESGGAMSLSVRDIDNRSTASSKADIYAAGPVSIQGNHTLDNVTNGTRIASIVSANGTLSIDSRAGDASTQSVNNEGGLMFGGQGLRILVARLLNNRALFDPLASSYRRGQLYAANGNMLLGGLTSDSVSFASQDITVNNIDSDIEARTGNVTINASYIGNITQQGTPATGTDAYRLTSGSYAGFAIYSNCGTYADNFGEEQLFTRCAQYLDVTQQYLINPGDLSPRSKMIAGGSLNLWTEKEAWNYVSLMSAGADININGSNTATFKNQAIELLRRDTAKVYQYLPGDVQTLDPVRCTNVTFECYYDFPGGLGTNDLLVVRKRFEDISPPAQVSYTTGMPSTVQAVGSINVSIGRVVNASGRTGELRGPAYVAPAGSTPAGGTPTGAPGTGLSSLTGSPFFIPASNPTSPYLFETDPRLLSLSNLYGSDLFLASLGLDPAQYLRVGDPYFEQQLLRQQLLAQAGQLFIADGLAGENDQFKFLMENAVAAKDDLQLRVGVALTKEQLANLKKDIVWMVEMEVDGRKALVPQLYLSDVTQAKLADGARFVASNINVKTEGSITNSGAFVASSSIDLKAGTTFTNAQGTLVAANGLSVAATGDIINQSGTIRGGDVALVSTQGSIVNETLKRDLQFGSVGTSTVLGETASIESSGDLKLGAMQNIVSRGGNVSADGNATLRAGNDITFTAIEQKSVSASSSSAQVGGFTTDTNRLEQTTRQVGSGLSVGGNLDARAARDINIEASSVDVAGNGSLDAGRNINITALGETSRTNERTNTSGANSRFTETTTIERTTGAASALNIRGNLAVASGGDTNIKGSDVAVGGNLDVKNIGGNLNVTTFEEKVKVESTTTSSSSFGAEVKADAGKNITESTASATLTLFSNSEEKTSIDATTNRGSGISIGGNLNAGPGAIKGDVNIVGSSLATGGDMNLAAGGNINVLAARDTTTVTNSSTSNAFTLGGEASLDGASAGFGYERNESKGSATQTTASVSGLRSGGNININAGGDFTEQGTRVSAGGDIAVEADRINSLAAQNTYTETGDSLSVSASLGGKVELGLGAVVGSFVDDKTNKAGFDMAAASESLNDLSVPDAGAVSGEFSISSTKTTSSSSGNEAVASDFRSGGNTRFRAREGDATFQGTQVEAGGSIDVAADKGSVNIRTADSSSRSTTSTTESSVTVGISADLTLSGSGSGSEKTETEGSTSQQAASFKAGKDLNITAQKDVTLVGTSLQAAGDATVEAKEGKIDFLAARDTTSATSNEVSANASVSVSLVGKEGSVGGGGGTMNSSEASSTGKAGSLSAANIVLKSRGDITLEGTKVTASNNATVETQGKLDFKALESTSSSSKQGASAQVDIEASATGGGAKVAGSRTDESAQSTTRTGGSLSATNLTVKAGQGVRLEGTQVEAKENASIDAGSGKLVIESAVSTSTKRVNNTSVEVGAKGDAKEGSGQGSFKLEGAYEDTNKVSNQNATIKVGGNADIKAAGGVDIKGTKIEGVGTVIQAGSTNLNGAAVSIEQRQDVDQSTKSNVSVSVGVIVPDRKARREVAETVQRIKDSDAANTVRNRVGNATTAISNAADTAKTRIANLGSDADTRAKADTNLAQRVQDRKDTNTASKLANNTAQADRNAARAAADIDSKRARDDQKADFDRQRGDDRAARERDQALARLAPDAPQSDKDQIQRAFESAQTANAEKAATTKLANATQAAAERDKVLTQQGNDKLAAQRKADDSAIRHREDKAVVEVAMAKPATESFASNDARRDAQIRRADDVGRLQADKAAHELNVQADTARVQAEAKARADRDSADVKAQNVADAAVLKARQEQARKDAAVDADAQLDADQKAARKEANAAEAQKAMADANKTLTDAKRANADKAAQSELLARDQFDKDRIAAEQKKQEGIADAEMKRDLLVPDDEVRMAMANADVDRGRKVRTADRELRDAEQAADSKRLADDGRIEQQRNQVVIEANQALTQAYRQADADFDKARLDADATLAATRKVIEGRTDQSPDEKKQRLEVAQAAHDQRIAAAEAEKQKARTAAAQENAQRKDAAQRVAEASKAETAQAAEKSKLEAKAKRDDAVAQADKDRDSDQGIVKAKEEQQKRLEKRREDAVAKAAESAKQQERIAALDKQLRDGLQKSEETARTEQTRIERDSSLSADQKALALKKVADDQAVAKEQLQKKRADEAQVIEMARDAAERRAELAAVDPSASPADKAAQAREINKKYDERSAERKKHHDDAIASAERDKKQAQAVAQADFAERQAKATADEKRKTADDQARKDYDSEVAKIDQKLAAEKASKKPDEIAQLEAQARRDKDAKALERDQALIKSQSEADIARAGAEADRSKTDAELVRQRELAELDAVTPKPATYDAQKKAIEERKAEADRKASGMLAARTRDLTAIASEKTALAAREAADAKVDADTALSEREKRQRKAENQKAYETAQANAEKERSAAKEDMAKLLTPAEKAAADAAAAKAEKEGARVKNPYAMTARLKPHLVKAERWKQVVTSFGLHVDRRPPPPDEPETEEASLVDLLALARQFQAGEQPRALQLLRVPEVQNAAAINAAVDALREEARTATLKAIREEYAGGTEGVMTVDKQRQALSDFGVSLPADLTPAEVTKRFNEHLDASVASLQPDDTQKAAILKALGVDVQSDQTVAEAYEETLTTGLVKARERALSMGMSLTQAEALVAQFRP